MSKEKRFLSEGDPGILKTIAVTMVSFNLFIVIFGLIFAFVDIGWEKFMQWLEE